MTVLFVNGVNDENLVLVRGLTPRGSFSWTFDGCSNVQKYLEIRPEQSATITMFGPGAEQSEIRFARTPALIFNQVSDPDTHKVALQRCAVMCAQLDVPVINHPDRIAHTTRDAVSDLLQDIPGLHVPRTIRIAPRKPGEVFEQAELAGLEYPVIVRLAGYHNGLHMLRITGRDDRDELHTLPFDGRDFYVTEYVDYRDENGHYSKTRVVFVDGEPHYRNNFNHTQWNVHYHGSIGQASERPEAYSLERLSERGKHRIELARPALAEAARRIGLEFFAMDCHLDEQGRVLLFEANATVSALQSSSGEAKDIADGRIVIDAIRKMISDKSGLRLD